MSVCDRCVVRTWNRTINLLVSLCDTQAVQTNSPSNICHPQIFNSENSASAALIKPLQSSAGSRADIYDGFTASWMCSDSLRPSIKSHANSSRPLQDNRSDTSEQSGRSCTTPRTDWTHSSN